MAGPRFTDRTCSTIISFSVHQGSNEGREGRVCNLPAVSSFAAGVIRFWRQADQPELACRLFLRSNQKFDCERIPISELGSRSSPVLGQERGSGTIGWRVCALTERLGCNLCRKRKENGKSRDILTGRRRPCFSTSIQNRHRSSKRTRRNRKQNLMSKKEINPVT